MHLWKGKEINDQELVSRLSDLHLELSDSLKDPIEVGVVIHALQNFNEKITKDELLDLLKDTDLSDDDKEYEVNFLKDFIKIDNINYKIKKELGRKDFLDFRRNANEKDIFEGRRPLGILMHFTPANSNVVSFLAIIEGLLTGNINILKMSRGESGFTLRALKLLGDLDPTGKIHKSIIALMISSSEQEIIQKLLSISNGASVWGGDSAVKEIRKIAPAQCKVISWGHKISFAYVTDTYFEDEDTLKKLAEDVINLEQQACSSPQCIFLGTDDYEKVKEFSQNFFKYLKKESDKKEQLPLDTESQCEITNISEMVKLEEVMNDSILLEDPARKFRIYVENNSVLTPSPLFRSVWIKPMPIKQINKSLLSWRNHLQTIGFAGDYKNEAELVNILLNTGATRITKIGRMLDTYKGEAHDGVYPLNAFLKEVRIELSDMDRISRISYEKVKLEDTKSKIMNKTDFQNTDHNLEKAKLFFKSGGSSGTTALSSFAYDDYYLLMDAASEGLIASGLKPRTDRVINLFFGGGLYGGMISFFTILERMEAIQFSMGAWQDFDFVADTIIENKINTLVGMTSYIMQLLQKCSEKLKKYDGIEKIFYGGEHFSEKQKEWVMSHFNVKMVKSASYGSVDAGPLGYQCEYSKGSIHHLHDNIHQLEILKLDSDEKVELGETGRLIFSTPARESITINRYEIGDTGRWISEQCECGRTSPQFELQGRMGDIFKASGTFINYQAIENILRDQLSYNGELQLVITNEGKLDCLEVLLDKKVDDEESVKEKIISKYKDLREVFQVEKSLNVIIRFVDSDKLIRTEGSGKLKRVVDKRVI